MDDVLRAICDVLPTAVSDRVQKFASDDDVCVEEIRLIAGCRASVVASRSGGRPKRTELSVKTSAEDVASSFFTLCGGSVYSHADTLRECYIVYTVKTSSGEQKLRVGVCGQAVTENGCVVGLRDPTSLNIRLPHREPGAGDVMRDILRVSSYSGGILLYSKPGEGKTTVLRELCVSLAADGVRVCAVDTRCELAVAGYGYDILAGFPRAAGIEAAARVMNPQVIVCDEIGASDAEAAAAAQCNGVPVIASIHAGSFAELMRKPAAQKLISTGAFASAVGIRRIAGGCGAKSYEWTVDSI
jgi:stage III sporulation protein AA